MNMHQYKIKGRITTNHLTRYIYIGTAFSLYPLEDLFMHNHCLCDQLRIRISVSVYGRAARTTSKRTSLNSKQHVSLVFCVSLVNLDASGGTSRPLQAMLMSPKGRNASRDGFVNLNISLSSIASFGSLTPAGLALLFCFSLIRRSLSIATTWNQQYIYTCKKQKSS